MAGLTAPKLLDAFLHLKRWKRGAQLAPHKPLVLLYALGRVARNERRLVSFEEARPVIQSLLAEFGPPRARLHASYPFWRLQNDHLVGWDFVADRKLRPRESNSDPPERELIQAHAMAGFAPEVHQLLANDPQLVEQLASAVLDQFFPATLQDDIRNAVGLGGPSAAQPQKRDQRFRLEVLRAYSYRCAVCGFDGKLDSIPLAIEAAHIKWHQWGGPGTVDNGVALCSLHHKVFDRGAITLVDGAIHVAKSVHGSTATRDFLLRFHGTRIELPRELDDRPRATFIEWHRRNVFRG